MAAAHRPKRLTLQARRDLMSSPRAMRWAQPSGDLISAILQYADVQLDIGGGRTLLRLSERRRADAVITGSLGREAPRLAEVAVIWDEDEGQIFRVLDAGAGDHIEEVAQAPRDEDEPQFELTPAALAYLAASGGAH